MAALSCSTVPKITVIVGNAVGPVHYLMVSYALLILGGVFMVVICTVFVSIFWISLFFQHQACRPLCVFHLLIVFVVCACVCVLCLWCVCVHILFVCEWCVVICTVLLLPFYFACFLASGLTD